MTYVDRNAIYAINRYIGRLLEANVGWGNISYTDAAGNTGTGSRIIPSAQQPELMESGKGFMVYGSTVTRPGHLYANRAETIAYTIYSPDVNEVNKVVNLLVDVFERQDESVADVNFWLDREREARGTNRNLAFTTIHPSLAEKAEPADEEGGYVSAMFMMDVTYVVNNDTYVTRPGQGSWVTP